jgi:HK97 family phage major capsid protein
VDKLLAQIIERMKKIDADQAEIERVANLESNGEFTDEQRKEYKALKSLFDDLDVQKKQLEDDIDMRNARADREEAIKPRVVARRAPSNSGAPVARRSGQPIEVENQETGEVSVRFRIPANVSRFTPVNFKNYSGQELTAQERAYRFGQWCLAKASADLPGRYNFAYAKDFVRNYMNPQNAAHGESDATTGGNFLVPEEFSADLIVLREKYGVARRVLKRVPMTSDTLNIPKRASGLTAYFVNESSQATESNMTWSNVQLVAKKLMCIARMSNELSADAVISIGDTLAGEISYAFANQEDLCAFNGDGTSTYGGIAGLRYRITNIDGAGTDSAGKKAASGNAWSAITLADFNGLAGLLPQFADTDGTCFLCHKNFYYGVMQKLEMAAGGNALADIATGDRGPRPRFLGYPVEFSQVFPSASASAHVPCLLGDFGMAALFGDRAGVSISFSEHATVNSTSVYEYDQIAVRGTERFDVVVHGYGDANTVGAYVGLETT